ncbi:hypothetical protein RhiirA1_458026 [Rhizophagus irregularis]|uniref:Uncharacterized protein n=1 Tax=Rhizophagus irregularis TaxID=588596 RepID=A0A2N0RWR7_9GLOM|nr:hypothetical protein RhiirA1_458026 [Rhizophagus irregularis]
MPTWSLSSDFSLIHNPSSVWSFGSKPGCYQVTGMFSLFTHLDPEPTDYSEIVAWFGSDTEPNTDILTMFTANGVAIHPGNDADSITVRANEPIDFIVGVGLDNSFACDMTLARVDIHLLENQIESPVIAGSIRFCIGQNGDAGYEVIG